MTDIHDISDTVRLAGQTACATRRNMGTDLQPMLHIVSPSGQVSIAVLTITGGGREVAFAARSAILQLQPEHAVVLFEGWTVRKGLDRDDRDLRAVQAGILRVGQLPAHKRATSLTAFGESANGDEAYAFYYLQDNGSFSEMLNSWAPEGRHVVETHLRPLFPDRWLLRELDPELNADVLGEHKVLHLLNRACRKYLQAVGSNFVPRGFNARMEEIQEETRRTIGWRKRRQA